MDEVNNRAGEGDNIDECDVSWRPWKIAIMEAIIWNKKVFYERVSQMGEGVNSFSYLYFFYSEFMCMANM